MCGAMSKSPRRLVTGFDAAWSPARNVGQIRVRLEQVAKPWLVRCDDAAEFAAILQLLRGPAPVYGGEDGWLSTVADGTLD